MKRMFWISLTVVLICSMTFAYAGGTNEETGAASGEDVRIAVALADSGASIFSLMGNNVKEFMRVAGGSAVFERTGFDTDRQIAFVENQIAAGVDGIVIAPAADSVANIISRLCEEAGVYWGIPFRSIVDEDIRNVVESSPYYVGNCYENEVESSYNVMKRLHEMGIENIAIISQAIGDTTAGQRELGVEMACKDFGMNVVAEARALSQATDVTSATESFLSSHRDLDCVFILATTAAGSLEAAGKAIRDSGNEQVKIACIDFQDGMVSLFEEGILVCASGLPHWGIDPFMTVVKTANAAMGYAISEQSFSTSMNMLQLMDADMARRYEEVFSTTETLFYTEEEIRGTLLKQNNTSLAPDTFQEIVNAYNPLN